MKIQIFYRRLFLVALIAAISLAVVGQQSSSQLTPSVERLRAHIEYLASDKLEGRRTGTAGAGMAAEYIAREFARWRKASGQLSTSMRR